MVVILRAASQTSDFALITDMIIFIKLPLWVPRTYLGISNNLRGFHGYSWEYQTAPVDSTDVVGNIKPPLWIP